MSFCILPNGKRYALVCTCGLTQLCLILSDPLDCSPPGSPSMGFFRQEYRSGLPFPPPGDLPDPGIEPASLAFPTLAGRFFTIVPPGKLMWFIEALHNSFLINFLRARDSKTWSDGPLGFRAPWTLQTYSCVLLPRYRIHSFQPRIRRVWALEVDVLI